MPAIKYRKKTYAGGAFPVMELTKAEYNALPEAKKMDGTVYLITDDDAGWEAERSTYDNTASGLTATNVQAALDEITNNITFVTTTTALLSQVQLAAGASTSYAISDAIKTGYKPLMYYIQPGNWCDHISIAIPTAHIEGNTVKIGTMFLLNTSNGLAQSIDIWLTVLWQKI